MSYDKVYHKKWRENNKNHIKKYWDNWYEENRDKYLVKKRLYNAEYRKTENFKNSIKKSKHKRKNNYNFNILYDNLLDEKVDWHHINDNDVVAIPRDLHKLYVNPNKEIHRENLQYIVKQLY